MFKRTAVLFFCLGSILGPAAGAWGQGKSEKGSSAGSNKDLKVEVAVVYKNLDGKAEFIVGDGMKANHVEGGHKHFSVGETENRGLEFKKWGFVVNVLPLSDPENNKKVSMQIQVELSGPTMDGMDVNTWQFQSEVTLVKGKKKTLVKLPANVEVLVTDSK